jgi:hypothetical protein
VGRSSDTSSSKVNLGVLAELVESLSIVRFVESLLGVVVTCLRCCLGFKHP